MLTGKVDYEGYQKLLRILTSAGLIEVIAEPSYPMDWNLR